MLLLSIGFLAVAALFGLYLAARIFGGALAPWAPALTHGLFAATGLLTLIYAAYSGPPTAPVLIAAALLVVAALGGFILFGFHLRQVVAPKALVAVHAAAAVTGFGILAAAAFQIV